MSRIENPYHYVQGDSPILVSIPHAGLSLLPEMSKVLSKEAKTLPDTDWYVTELYDFLCDLNVSVISANYSRYVIDLNRPVDDKPLYSSKTTGLFPEISFSAQPVFIDDSQHSESRKEQIKTEVWQPYHQKIASELARIKAKFGYAILFDAHSIAAEVPMLFDGRLPDFNFGTNGGDACSDHLLASVNNVVAASGYSHVCNGRFKGGHITRFFGQPNKDIHAIQLELSQATYLQDSVEGYQMDSAKKQQISPLLKQMINALIEAGAQLYSLKNENRNEANDE
ncbi:N-formylglutamate deformylase [Vibrio sp. F74]|uniref:N-formylglutamate deformylase n=1 Tax=Vibrio sp. F74 TaxID=700020 RepID=UPI0035F584B5